MARTSIVGDVINFRGLVYGPVNEMGVVALFSKISEDMGFIIEEVRAGFPDCIARRQIDKGWERVAIEFEYKSSNFWLHGHDPEACDLIVCWQHDWDTCPVPVLSLKQYLADGQANLSSPLAAGGKNEGNPKGKAAGNGPTIVRDPTTGLPTKFYGDPKSKPSVARLQENPALLREPQKRILASLCSESEPVPRKVLAQKAEVDLAYSTSYIGSEKEPIRRNNDRRVFPSLLSCGFVRSRPAKEGRGVAYEITPEGRKAAEQLATASK